MIGRYIDSLPDYAIDRLITAQKWRRGEATPDGYGKRCLIGNVEDWQALSHPLSMGPPNYDTHLAIYRTPFFKQIGVNKNGIPRYTSIPMQFDRLTNRFGLEKIVRLCKLRAGRRNAVPISPPTREVSMAQN